MSISISAGSVCFVKSQSIRQPPHVRIDAHSHHLCARKVGAASTCSESFPGDPITVCIGPVARGANIDTSSVGSKNFAVNATDSFNNSSASVNYTVAYGI